MVFSDLGTMPYRDAWAVQERAHAEVVAGAEEQVLLVQHPPVITLGRRAGQMVHVLSQPATLQADGVELVESDRGGDVTYHGPGQLVVYPIIRLNDHQLSVGRYVHTLEEMVIDLLAELGVSAHQDRCAVGVWTNDGKVCAIGVRIRRGVTLHGLALNVTTNLDHFDLIVPCGLAGRSVTSLQKLLRDDVPSMDTVKQMIVARMIKAWGTAQ